jgi:O-acetylhomoserine/O-acetylserine sulfhydrylase-like pyridoxal-dependent enzyme
LFDEVTLRAGRAALKWIAMKCMKQRAKRKKAMSGGRNGTATLARLHPLYLTEQVKHQYPRHSQAIYASKRPWILVFVYVFLRVKNPATALLSRVPSALFKAATLCDAWRLRV